MALVFVSYSRKDETFVRRLAADLRRHGVPVWLDKDNIPAGARWDVSVENAVEDASHLLLVLSPASVRSPNVRDEIDVALSEEKRIIPVLLADCKPPLRVRRLQYTDFRGDYEAALGELLKVLPRTAAARSGPAGERHARFWAGLLERASIGEYGEGLVPLRPGNRSALTLPAGYPGLRFRYAIHRSTISVGLEIERPSRGNTGTIYDALAGQKAAIEQSFGGPLLWERRDTRRVSRISAVLEMHPGPAESGWQPVQDALLAAMARLQKALRPVLEATLAK